MSTPDGLARAGEWARRSPPRRAGRGTLSEPLAAPGSPKRAHDADGDDEDDLRAARRGDRTAFDRLVLRHQNAVVQAAYYAIGSRHDALEVAQETFLNAYRALSRFRGEASLRTWLLRIALNTARSTQAKRRAKKRAAPGRAVSLHPDGSDSAIDPPDERHSPAALLERKERKEAIEAAIAALEPEARQIVVLRDLSGESYEAIARILALPLGTVKSKVHRARLQLREKLRRYL